MCMCLCTVVHLTVHLSKKMGFYQYLILHFGQNDEETVFWLFKYCMQNATFDEMRYTSHVQVHFTLYT